MKRVLIAFLLCFVFSSEIQAKKVMITSTHNGSFSMEPTASSCFYSISTAYGANVHAHKSNELALNVLVGDVVTPLYTAYFAETKNAGKFTHSGTWKAGRGESWSLVWVIQSTKGKGHIIDAVEMASGICNT